jgi:hypothetical protein
MSTQFADGERSRITRFGCLQRAPYALPFFISPETAFLSREPPFYGELRLATNELAMQHCQKD